MKKFKRILSVVLVLSMLTSITVMGYGDDGQSSSTDNTPEEQGGSTGNATDGFTNGDGNTIPFGYRMGLARCTNEPLVYDLSDKDAKANAIQRYNAKYYMRPEGETVVMSSNSNATLNYDGSVSTLASDNPVLYGVMSEIVNNSPGTYTEISGYNGALSIIPTEENVSTIMNALADLGGTNRGLVEQWKQEAYSMELASYPVVIVIEVVGLVTEGGRVSWWSASDYAARIGVQSQLLHTDLTQYENGQVSMTCNALAQMGGYANGTSNGDNWPYRFTKRFFNCSYNKRLHGPSARYENVFGEAAAMAWATLTDQHTGINGQTVVSIGGNLEGISGSYTWHINASRLPENAEGYREDNYAESDGDKLIGIGAVNIKNTNVAQWQEWIIKNGGPFTIDIQKYWVVGGNFSVQYGEVVNKRISASTNTLSSATTEQTYTVDAQTLLNYIQNGSDLDINGMQGGAQDVLGGSPMGDQYRVAYVTTVDVVAGNGEVVHLTNSQVHFAIYGEDNDKTYKFNQILQEGKSQVKQGDGGLDTEEYEAMSGTPTTKDLFVTQGGEQFLVQLQYRYVDETYLRNYQLKSGDGKEEYHNYMYYQIKPGDKSTTGTGSATCSNGTSTTSTCDISSTALRTANDTAWKTVYNSLKSWWSDFEIDNNYKLETDFDKYTLCTGTSAGTGNSTAAYDDLKRFINGLPSFMSNGTLHDDEKFEKTFFKADDLDSSVHGEVKLTIEITGSEDCTDPGGSYDKHSDTCASKTGQDCDCTPTTYYYHGGKHTYTYSLTITVNYTGTANDAVAHTDDMKKLSYDDTLEQRYEHTRYMDIVECKMWRMEQGKQKGMRYILAEPTEEVLEMAVEQMGYCLYDSTQTDAREWDASAKQWTAVDMNDLEETGRLLNSYNETTVDLGDTKALIVEDKDNFIVEYNMENGGRSHHSYEAYFARIAGYMFYNGNSTSDRYQNFMFNSSDVFDINTGNSANNGHETFCWYEFNTEKVKHMNTLEQFLMKDSNNIYIKMRSKGFSKGQRSSDVLQAKNSQGGFMSCAYLGGKVDLSKMDTGGSPYANTYNKLYIAEENPYTFFNSIPEINGITWVGYRGDYLTTSVAHEPTLKCISGFEFDMSSAIVNDEWYGRHWLTDPNKNKLVEDIASAGSEFPYKTGLNVNRTQDNNRYATGYASILYENEVQIDHTQLAQVLPLVPFYAGASLNVQDSALEATSPGTAIRATYDTHWTTPNDIVIFNPSTAEDAYVKKLSTYIPDTNGVGEEDADYPIRDQRVGGTYVGTNLNNGVFFESSDIISGSDILPSMKRKQLKEWSTLSTSYYTYDKDYNLIENDQEIHAFVSVGTTYTAPETADYTFQVYDNHGDCTAVRVHLEAGEKIRNDSGTLYKIAKSAVVTWDDYILGVNTDYDVENPFQITNSRIDSYFLRELADVKAGDVLHLHYKFADYFADSTKPFDVNFVVSDSTAIDTKYIHTSNGHDWDYYVEFSKDCVVERINVEFNVNTKLEQLSYREYMFEFVDALIVSTGDTYSSPANESTTIDFVLLKNQTCAYNKNIADYEVATYMPTSDIVPYRYYGTYRKTEAQFVIKQSSSNNPHIVYNSNWKYYVVGWKTANGNTIKSPVDTLLDYPGTVLEWPSGIGTITVGELENQACLVKYGGVVYLTTKEYGFEHIIPSSSPAMSVTAYDVFTFAGDTTGFSYELVGESHNVSYPLLPGQTGASLFQNAIYEFFFSCTTGSNADGYLYDVRYAKNQAYRFGQNDESKIVDSSVLHSVAWECDWDEIDVPMSSTVLGLHSVDYDKDATFLSLDDKFQIHYSNIGNYYETDHHNSGSMNVDLGYGWVNGLDTITWIRTKYVVFPFDVYTFGYNNTYGAVDPSVTYDEYMNGLNSGLHEPGTVAQLTFHPAKEPIELGYYEGDSGPADNAGHYIDFGSRTGYDYSFWVCLSSNETANSKVILNSSNINNNYDLEANKQENNKDTPSNSFWRYANAMRQHVISIVGRVGNLTMLDTGDYRFSDTFKTTDRTDDWLVYGLIRKLRPYTNEAGTFATQKALLVDPWDVRGIGSMTNLLPSRYSGYAAYSNEGYSTYMTQWHKVGDRTRIESLPLTSAFNEHDALKLTQQKIGYANLLTLDSIGNYFGSNGQFVNYDEMDVNTEQVNSNGDWSNQKMQIRPYYIAIDISTMDSFPVDVWMRTNEGYEMINSGSTDASAYLDVFYNNRYNYYLTNNTEDEDPDNRTYKLDQNMLRRMVTTDEAKITYQVIKDWSSGGGETEYMSMLTNPETLAGRAWDILNQYCYGNGQYLFLRARNRTFVGANSIALNYGEGAITGTTQYRSHAQMWYFDLGLPTSAVFMHSGEPFDPDKIVKDENIYILSCVDVYALGEVWDLHYKSPVSIAELELNGVTIPPEVWNPVNDKLPWLVPVTFYGTADTTAKDDLTTEGTH